MKRPPLPARPGSAPGRAFIRTMRCWHSTCLLSRQRHDAATKVRHAIDPYRDARRSISKARAMNEAEVDIAITALEAEMQDLQFRYRDLFAYANAWAERYDAILGATPEPLRVSRRGPAAARRHPLGRRARCARDHAVSGAQAPGLKRAAPRTGIASGSSHGCR